MRICLHEIILVAALASGWGCRSFAPTSGLSDAPGVQPSTVTRDNGSQIMAAPEIDRLKKALPAFAYKGISEILSNPDTLWYDHKTVTPSYQDSVGDGTSAPIGARPNSRAEGIIVPEGKHLFTGTHWTFPFGVTAGTDESTNVETANFLYLPSEAGKKLPLVYWIEINKRNFGIDDTKWKWLYPKGTVIGELIFVKDGTGAIYLTELRTRTRYLSGWATNAYRPFDSAAKLSQAIKAKRPNYAQIPSLTLLLSGLDGAQSMKSLKLNSTAFPGVFNQAGSVDVLPDFGDEELVKDLLKSTPFVSVYGSTWKQVGGEKSFAPSTASSFSIVPKSYQGGVFEVSEKSCMRCHQDAGRAINDFVGAAVLYGDIWGEDGIFSFHPYDETRYSIFNTENRAVRPELTRFGIVEKYESSKHPPSIYKAVFSN